ncbi:SHOCT domain-containing protein [Halostella sp. JP-L12]|nr:SHOCT domain-containing protein [Halostella sp. JP-L12]
MNASLLVFLQMGDGMGPGGWGFGYGFVGLAVMLLVFGTVVYLLARALGGGNSGGAADRSGTAARSRSPSDEDTALAELRERYARGEIDDEEFEKRAQRLRSDSNSVE